MKKAKKIKEAKGDLSLLGEALKRGVVSPPRQALDVNGFLGRKLARTSGEVSAVRILIEERRAGK